MIYHMLISRNAIHPAVVIHVINRVIDVKVG